MITKADIKYIKSLQNKKERVLSKKFIIEGEKIVNEALIYSPTIIDHLYATSNFIEQTSIPDFVTVTQITIQELDQISTLTTPNKAVAICNQLKSEQQNSNLLLALDHIQDPGNLGTIIRLADWFGISEIICSENTVDCYNPKVIQSTMGAIFRVKVSYRNLIDYLEKTSLPIYGALLNGENVFTTQFNEKGIILLGNEGNGISEVLKKFITNQITIPKFGEAESLNVAMAASIIVGSYFQSLQQ
ncbi:MAG: RNA methyltransferase [Crocinitomicaceae bacterium]|jgi:RNA methyltransferase, TrmH family|nr:RNA methyltransferase [Crocinitomicaceae bacterium]